MIIDFQKYKVFEPEDNEMINKNYKKYKEKFKEYIFDNFLLNNTKWKLSGDIDKLKENTTKSTLLINDHLFIKDDYKDEDLNISILKNKNNLKIKNKFFRTKINKIRIKEILKEKNRKHFSVKSTSHLSPNISNKIKNVTYSLFPKKDIIHENSNIQNVKSIKNLMVTSYKDKNFNNNFLTMSSTFKDKKHYRNNTLTNYSNTIYNKTKSTRFRSTFNNTIQNDFNLTTKRLKPLFNKNNDLNTGTNSERSKIFFTEVNSLLNKRELLISKINKNMKMNEYMNTLNNFENNSENNYKNQIKQKKEETKKIYHNKKKCSGILDILEKKVNINIDEYINDIEKNDMTIKLVKYLEHLNLVLKDYDKKIIVNTLQLKTEEKNTKTVINYSDFLKKHKSFLNLVDLQFNAGKDLHKYVDKLLYSSNKTGI